MDVEVIPEYRLTPAIEAGIADLLARAFETDFGGRSFYQQRHSQRLVVRAPGIVAHAALGFRAVRLGSALVDVATLAEVATDPSERGKGLAARLLQAAIAEARTSPATFLILFGTARLYGAHGFVPVANPMTWIDLSGARMGEVRHAPATHLMVLALRETPWDASAPLDLLGGLF